MLISHRSTIDYFKSYPDTLKNVFVNPDNIHITIFF